MSRNRTAILADIVEYNLDPNIAHKATHANGRLAKVAVQSEQTSVVAEPVVETVAEETPAVVEAAPVVEADPVVVPEESPVEPKVEETPKKKGKKSAATE